LFQPAAEAEPYASSDEPLDEPQEYPSDEVSVDEPRIESVHPLDEDQSELHGPSPFGPAADAEPNVSSDEPLDDSRGGEYEDQYESKNLPVEAPSVGPIQIRPFSENEAALDGPSSFQPAADAEPYVSANEPLDEPQEYPADEVSVNEPPIESVHPLDDDESDADHESDEDDIDGHTALEVQLSPVE